jgi:hypothetical protein
MGNPAEVRLGRLERRAAGAQAVETAGWANQALTYFAVMKSIREYPDLWFTHTSDPKQRAKAIERSITNARAELIDRYREEHGSGTH